MKFFEVHIYPSKPDENKKIDMYFSEQRGFTKEDVIYYLSNEKDIDPHRMNVYDVTHTFRKL